MSYTLPSATILVLLYASGTRVLWLILGILSQSHSFLSSIVLLSWFFIVLDFVCNYRKLTIAYYRFCESIKFKTSWWKPSWYLRSPIKQGCLPNGTSKTAFLWFLLKPCHCLGLGGLQSCTFVKKLPLISISRSEYSAALMGESCYQSDRKHQALPTRTPVTCAS